MIKLSKAVIESVPLLLAATMVLVLFVGCSHFDSPAPTQSGDVGLDLWNPRPGDQIVPGRDVPILNEGYWDANGLVVNPALLAAPAPVVIGPAGGTLVLGLHRLVIPAGAVDRFVTFTMSYGSTTAIAVDCGPSPFRFNCPVELTLSYAGTQYESSDRQIELQIFYMASNLSCEAMPSRVDVAARTVTAQLDHFSRYIIG